MRDALRAALGDPTLAVAYWLPDEERYVDGDGAAIALPPPGDGRAVTEIAHGGRRVGALVHAAALRDEPELLRRGGLRPRRWRSRTGGSRRSCARGWRRCARRGRGSSRRATPSAGA